MEHAAAALECAVEARDIRDELLRVRAIPVQCTSSSELRNDVRHEDLLKRMNTLTVQSGHSEMKDWSHGIPAESDVTAGEIRP